MAAADGLFAAASLLCDIKMTLQPAVLTAKVSGALFKVASCKCPCWMLICAARAQR